MKKFLLGTLRLLFYPFHWCHRVIEEASQVCCDYDPIGFTDYMDFTVPSQPRRCQADISQGHVFPASLHHAAQVCHAHSGQHV